MCKIRIFEQIAKIFSLLFMQKIDKKTKIEANIELLASILICLVYKNTHFITSYRPFREHHP